MLFGIATSGVVLSTARWAADLEFTMNIVSDCCFDRDREVHKVLIEKVRRDGSPLTAHEFIDSLKA